MKKLFLGIIVSIVFIFLALHGVEFDTVLKALKSAKLIYLIPTILLFASLLILKSLRWAFILAPMKKISQKVLFPITCVGFMAIALIPMRVGEVARPYLVSSKSEIPMSAALATVFVERIMDSVTLIILLLFSFFGSDFPDYLMNAIYSLVFLVIVAIFLVVIFYYNFSKLLFAFNPLLRKFPEKIRTGTEGIVKNFSEGFKIISDSKRFIYTLFMSLLIWIVSALGIYTLFLFHSFTLSVSDAFVVLIVTTVGISLPAAPGFLGNFQFGCIVALSGYPHKAGQRLNSRGYPHG